MKKTVIKKYPILFEITYEAEVLWLEMIIFIDPSASTSEKSLLLIIWLKYL